MGAGTGEDAACQRSVPGGAGWAAGQRQRCESWVGTVVSGVGGEGQDAGPAGGGQVLQAATRLAETGSACDLHWGDCGALGAPGEPSGLGLEAR